MVELLKALMSGNGALSGALLLVTGALLWRNRRWVVRRWSDPAPRWRIVGRVAFALQAALFLWVSVFDYWRQLLGLLMTAKTRYYSDPYTVAPVFANHDVAAPVRAFTLVLLCAGAFGLALLCARSADSLLPLVGVVVVGALLYFVFSDARWRLEVWAANGFPQVGHGTTGDLLTDLAFFGFVVAIDTLSLLVEYLTLVALLALPLVALGNAITRRRARSSPGTRAFSELLSARAATIRADRRARERAPTERDATPRR